MPHSLALYPSLMSKIFPFAEHSALEKGGIEFPAKAWLPPRPPRPWVHNKLDIFTYIYTSEETRNLTGKPASKVLPLHRPAPPLSPPSGSEPVDERIAKSDWRPDCAQEPCPCCLPPGSSLKKVASISCRGLPSEMEVQSGKQKRWKS